MAWTDLVPYTTSRLTAAMLELLRGNFKAIGDAWTDYTPTWTAPTTNPTNYTGSGAYIKAGKWVTFRARVTAEASFTAGSGTYAVSLPFSILDSIGARFMVTAVDASTGNKFLGTTYSVSGTSAFVAYNDGTAVLASITNAAPMAFATGDYIEVTGTYEAA